MNRLKKVKIKCILLSNKKRNGDLIMKIFRAILFPLVYMIIYYFIQLAFWILGMSIMVSIMKIKQKMGYVGVENLIKIMGNVLVTAVIISGILSFFIYWGITYLRKQNMFKICNFKKVKLQYLVIALVFGIALNVINEYLLLQLMKFDIFSEAFIKYLNMTKFLMNTNIVLAILGVGIIGPIIEEIIFRGLIFKELKNVMPVPAVIIVQGVLFGIYHFNLIQFIYATFIGIMLGAIYVLTKNLWVPIFIHMVNNICAVLMPENQTVVTIISFGISIIVMILCYLYFYKEKKKMAEEFLKY